MLIALVAVVLWFHVLFVIALIKKDNSIADVGWGLSFVILSIVLFSQKVDSTLADVMLLVMISMWGLRLSGYIAWRKRGSGEDFRYQQWRNDWGSSIVWRSYLQVFILQMLIMLCIALPLVVAFTRINELTGYTLVGLGVMLCGLAIEVTADHQLAQFKKLSSNKGHIIQSGLWRWSRHPNYLGEAVFWWGVAVTVFPVAMGWLGVVSALLITWLLRYVSGVPMLEKKYQHHAEFLEYATSTPVFFPWQFFGLRAGLGVKA